jgi:DNA-binding helix-hairpin-helix protein with protein kinase domain
MIPREKLAMNCIGKNSKKYVLTEPPLASGGEGSVYNIVGDSKHLAKIYHVTKLQASPELGEKLEYMVNNPPDASVLDQIAWPIDVLRDSSGRFCGFVMPKLDAREELKNIYPYPPKAGTKINTDQKIVIAINICIVISAIHKAGYVFGDFNPNNIGVNLNNGHVGFFDTDSYHFTDIRTGDTYRCEVACDGYVAPELINHCHLEKRDFAHASLPTFTTETDNFALAIHIFKLLMNGYTPFNGIKESESVSQSSPGTGNLAIERDNYCFKKGNKPQSAATPTLDSLPNEIQILLGRTFLGGVSNPSSRATADEWRSALENMRNNLVQCTDDPDHMYFKGNKKCPYCEASKRYQNALAGFSPSVTSHRSAGASTGGQVSFSGASPIIIPSSNVGAVQIPSPQKQAAAKRQTNQALPGQEGKTHIILSILLLWVSAILASTTQSPIWSLGISVVCAVLILKIVFTVLRYRSIKIIKRIVAVIAVINLAIALIIGVPHGISMVKQKNLDTIIRTSNPDSLTDSELEKYQDAYLTKAKQLAESDNYQEAVELLAAYPASRGKDLISERLDEYALDYMNQIIERSNNYDRYDDAVEYVSEALFAIQRYSSVDTSKLEARLSEFKILAAGIPVYFDEIKTVTSEGSINAIPSGTVTDSYGNIHLGGNLYEADPQDYCVKNLNREFGKFSMTIAYPDEKAGKLTIKIVGDETVLYERTIGKDTEPTSVELDLSNIRLLTFSFSSSNYSAACYLIDPVFYRSPNYESKDPIIQENVSGVPLSSANLTAFETFGIIQSFMPLNQEKVNDSFGNEFTVGEFYLLSSIDSCYAQYDLDGKYKRFCFTLANADYNSKSDLTLQIVGNETILYEGTVGTYTDPTVVEIDISGVDILTINYSGSNGAACYLINPRLE